MLMWRIMFQWRLLSGEFGDGIWYGYLEDSSTMQGARFLDVFSSLINICNVFYQTQELQENSYVDIFITWKLHPAENLVW